MSDSGPALCWRPGRLAPTPTKQKVNLNLTALLLRACASSSPSLPALLSVQSLTSTVLSGTVRGCGGNCARTRGRGGRLPSAPRPRLTHTAQHKAASAPSGDKHQEQKLPRNYHSRGHQHTATAQEGPAPALALTPSTVQHCTPQEPQPCSLCSPRAGTSCRNLLHPARQSPALLSRDPRGWAPASATTTEVQLKCTSCCAQPESRIPSHCRSRAGLQTLQLSNLCLRHQAAPCTSPAQSPEPTLRPADMLSQHMVPQQTHLGEEAPDSASSQTTCT